MRVHRARRTVALEPALMELMRLYDRLGGPRADVARTIESEIERSLAERTVGREQVHTHLQQLLRARDLHTYVLEDEDLVALKLCVCERLLYHRTPGERWAAARELLLEHLDLLCRTPLPGVATNAELYKRAASHRESRLGKLLLTVALFNLDLVGEELPSNLILHFRRGGFPHYWWEICTPNGHTSHLGTLESWTPSEPLCRWEYLAADLVHTLTRSQRQPLPGRAGEHPAVAEPRTIHHHAAAGGADMALYARFAGEVDGDGPAQLELLPLDVNQLRAGLLQRVHRAHGPEGVKLLAVLCAHLGRSAGTGAIELPLAALAGEAGLGGLSARSLQTRMQRLERIAGELQQVELTRVSREQAGARARTSRLLTALSRNGAWSEAGAPRAGEGADASLLVMADPWLMEDAGAGFCAAFQELPPVLLECAGKDHPGLLPLYVWMRSAWRENGGQALERTARALLDEAGIWVSETGRYRAMEALKRDLEFMREQGWLGAWRLQRSELRDALEDRYRFSAPTAPAPRAQPPDRPRLPIDAGRSALPGA